MIKSIHKATALLSILADSKGEPVTLADLSVLSGINKSTCAHIISTLEADGYAVKISSSKGYIIGPAAYCLSRFGRYKDGLISVCRPFMKYLYSTTGYSVILAILEGDTKYIIDYIDDGRIFDTKTKIRIDDIYRTATGRVMLSNLTEDRLFSIYKKYGLPNSDEWPKFSNFNDFRKYILVKKSEKILSCRGINDTGTKINIGYATAIYNNVSCIGSLGVAVCISPDEEKNFLRDEEKIKRLLIQCTNQINRQLSSQL